MSNDPVGLCVSCVHARVVASSHGSSFYLCRLSEADPRFRRYPVLPVRSCVGFESQKRDCTESSVTD
jgi:hypothetical protein